VNGCLLARFEFGPRAVPICDLAIRHPGQKGLKLMTVRAYFDGSGKSHDPNVRCVALAGYVGTKSVWEEFESRWERFKEKYGIDYIHASELEAREGLSITASARQASLL
jgi:hypothetical protein